MKLSADQVKLFWRLWSAACQAQGWTREAGLTADQIDAHRKALLSDAGFSSLTLVDRTAGFGAIKARLMTLCGSIDGAIESDHPEMDDARRKIHLIRHDLALCLSLYVEDPVAYIEEIVRDKFGLARNSPVDLDSLSHRVNFPQPGCSQLDQALMTISARLNSFRKQAGHTTHDMRMLVGLPCVCARCRKSHDHSFASRTSSPF